MTSASNLVGHLGHVFFLFQTFLALGIASTNC